MEFVTCDVLQGFHIRIFWVALLLVSVCGTNCKKESDIRWNKPVYISLEYRDSMTPLRYVKRIATDTAEIFEYDYLDTLVRVTKDFRSGTKRVSWYHFLPGLRYAWKQIDTISDGRNNYIYKYIYKQDTAGYIISYYQEVSSIDTSGNPKALSSIAFLNGAVIDGNITSQTITYSSGCWLDFSFYPARANHFCLNMIEPFAGRSNAHLASHYKSRCNYKGSQTYNYEYYYNLNAQGVVERMVEVRKDVEHTTGKLGNERVKNFESRTEKFFELIKK